MTLKTTRVQVQREPKHGVGRIKPLFARVRCAGDRLFFFFRCMRRCTIQLRPSGHLPASTNGCRRRRRRRPRSVRERDFAAGTAGDAGRGSGVFEVSRAPMDGDGEGVSFERGRRVGGIGEEGVLRGSDFPTAATTLRDALADFGVWRSYSCFQKACVGRCLDKRS